jgi:hypothetical protein
MWFHLSILSPARFLYKEHFDWDMRRSQIRLANNIVIQEAFVRSQVINKVRTALSGQVCGCIRFSFFPQTAGLSLCNVDPSYSISFCQVFSELKSRLLPHIFSRSATVSWVLPPTSITSISRSRSWDASVTAPPMDAKAGRSWDEIHAALPHRSKGTLQVRYSTNITAPPA